MNDTPGIRRSDALGVQVYDLVLDRLRRGRIRPKQRIQEIQLATEFGVSRTPVREALARLVQDDFLRPDGRGFIAPALGAADIDHIYELRRLIEPHAAARAARMAAPSDAARLNAEVAASIDAHRREAVGDFIQANARFREAWLSLVDNPRLVRAALLYDDHVQHLRGVTLVNPKVRAIVIDGLTAIAAAIAGRDEVGARAAMEAHLDEAERAMRMICAQGDS